MASDARRVSDAMLREWVEVAGGSREGGMARELLDLRTENAALRAILADVAARPPVNYEDGLEIGRCAWCSAFETDPISDHVESCPIRRAVELVGDEGEGRA